MCPLPPPMVVIVQLHHYLAHTLRANGLRRIDKSIKCKRLEEQLVITYEHCGPKKELLNKRADKAVLNVGYVSHYEGTGDFCSYTAG
uniref:Uncharacterized protein n=1 Tax=Knipowitschia caucasica TaxID=637954 RepID=A0AAV2MAX8_KNICA